ncbi:MAG: hypothetical protein J2P37_21405 [Ktedonobacteraceae bacterium]|nr:hypothetical protein [Ktedonobacteraceae bacterium]
MSLALRKPQIIALFVLAFLTLVVLGLTLYSSVAHIDVWHTLTDIKPTILYGH